MPHSDPTAINQWWSILDDIDRMLAEVPSTMLTVSGYSMDLSGTTAAHEAPLPGGDALDIVGPWASNAAYADQATPRQVIVEWDQTMRRYWAGTEDPPAARSYAVSLRFLRDCTDRILESPYGDAWCTDIQAVHGRLRSLCPPTVDETHDSRTQPEHVDLAAMGHLIPDGTVMSRKDAEQFFPNITPTGWAALRKRAQRARDDGDRLPAGRYPIEWIRDHDARACA